MGTGPHIAGLLVCRGVDGKAKEEIDSINGCVTMDSQLRVYNYSVGIVIVPDTTMAAVLIRKVPMPSIIRKQDQKTFKWAFENPSQKGPLVVLRNTPALTVRPFQYIPENRNTRLVPKPMTQADIDSVRIRTGFSCFIETKFVRP